MWEAAEVAKKKDVKEEIAERVKVVEEAAFGNSSSSRSPPVSPLTIQTSPPSPKSLIHPQEVHEEDLPYAQQELPSEQPALVLPKLTIIELPSKKERPKAPTKKVVEVHVLPKSKDDEFPASPIHTKVPSEPHMPIEKDIKVMQEEIEVAECPLKDTKEEKEIHEATGKAGGGFVLHDSNGEVVMKKHVKLPDSTSNNEAEYDILLHGLQVCVSQKIRRLMVKGDALLIVKQILGIWACKNERLREKVQAIRRLFNQFEEMQLYHIPRKQNEVADLLAQKVVACDESEVQVILAATAIKQPRYQGMESLAPIVSYILEGEFPQSFTKAQKQRLMEKASSYLFLEGALYQRGKDQVCRRIPTVEEIPSILEGLRMESCIFLVYGQEALQHIELNIPTMRLHGKAAQRKEEERTDRLLTLAELEWKREAAYECYKRKATKVKDKLDKEVKDKGIKEVDLVLRYVNRLDNRFDAKFETRWQGPYIVKKAFNSSYYQLMDLDEKEHRRKVNAYLSQILPKDLQDQRQKSTL
ncbi:hypothetical protein L7F22_060264 [Adiantum nelumboides]|nr:hypothetical protein [Adiantum nelumboides]